MNAKRLVSLLVLVVLILLRAGQKKAKGLIRMKALNTFRNLFLIEQENIGDTVTKISISSSSQSILKPIF
jgi:hypothetical protein